MHTLLKNQTSLNEDLIIPEDKKSNFIPSPKQINQNSKVFGHSPKNKSGMPSNDRLEVQEDNHQKSANDALNPNITKETVKRGNEDSLMNIKDSGFNLLQERPSLVDVNDSGDKIKNNFEAMQPVTE